MKRDCRKLAALKKKESRFNSQLSASTAAADSSRSSDPEDTAMVATHALAIVSSGRWTVDSGATCHMCHNRKKKIGLGDLREAQEATLGDGHVLNGTAIGM